MAQPQPQVPQRTFSPASQMAPSPVSHPGTPFSGQPPVKKPRLSPAPSPQELTQSGATFSPIPGNNLLTNNNSPATPGTPNSLASPTPTSISAPMTHAPGGLPLPSSVSPPTTASPISAPPSLPPTGGHGTYSASTPNGTGHGTPTMQHPSTPSQMFSPRSQGQMPGVMTPTGPPTPSGPPLPHIAPAPIPPNASAANAFAAMAGSPVVQTPTGVMGPPLKPADRQAKEYQYDVDDSLAGTGIDLRQEEQFQADYFAGSFRQEARTGFPANAPGRRSSFYGALVANQPVQTAAEVDQQKAVTAIAKAKWEESARTLAVQRSNALRNPLLELNVLHARVDKIAREYGIGVILDPKPNASGTVKLRQDVDFPQPRLTVSTKRGPDGVTMVTTSGTFLPEDTYLADQFALLSLAAKHRIRELLEDANKVAVTRQRTSHGVVPDEWIDAAAPLSGTTAGKGDDGSANGSRSNSLKRPLEADGDEATSAEAAKSTVPAVNTLAQSLRVVGREERELEEKRLLKRQRREGKIDLGPTTATPRAGTPGTPGSVAPEPDKPPTKKEQKKNAAAKMTEQNDTLSANRTSMAFLGGRKKQYSWMSGGSSTPKRGFSAGGGMGGGGGGPGGPGGGAAAGGMGGGGAGGAGGRRPGEPAMLTGEGRTRLGTWREDGPKGQDIQLRDWVVVLEADGREPSALQQAYSRLDGPVASKPTA
ncbi:hypothetical protein CMQ_4007 [Grosmannia clavigera kw1407]|uniref:Transcription initiation factor TFIID subunit 4 n=1 Tax=Grosmannia clavigera (strain kw1407 / UAMH 11150) TaxID=655863 RepID=F0XA32_GROCL|nr:uncharacterized protein CMQ_4007 [Grosmannia clavigera kw1407]EFX05938.1 hypothetical protein CMQ_4007 [Grosmannia clavigera kw1407]